MPYTSYLVHELNTLIRFYLETGLQGIKVHKTADKQVIAELLRIVSNAIEKINPSILNDIKT